MRLQIEPSEMIVDLNGVQVRVWNGISEQGVQVFVFVHRLAVRNDDDLAAFERELIDMPSLRVTRVDELLREQHQPSITCPVCSMTSYNANDVLHGWCGNCKRQTTLDTTNDRIGVQR